MRSSFVCSVFVCLSDFLFLSSEVPHISRSSFVISVSVSARSQTPNLSLLYGSPEGKVKKVISIIFPPVFITWELLEKKGFPSITFYFLSEKTQDFSPPPNLWNWMGKEKRLFCEKQSRGKKSCSRRIFTLTALLVMKWHFEHQKKHWSTSLSAAPVTIITINKDVKWSRSFIRPRPLNVTAWSDSWWWTVFHLRLTADQHRLQHNPP